MLVLNEIERKHHHFDDVFFIIAMAGAGGGVNQFGVAHNSIRHAAHYNKILVTTYHNRGHLNPNLVPNKSIVDADVDKIKLIQHVVRLFRTGKYLPSPDGVYSVLLEAEFEEEIGTLRSGTGRGRFLYIRLRKETHLLFRNNYDFYVSTFKINTNPILNVQNGPHTQFHPNRTIPRTSVTSDW